jgi:hypothetical protein
MKKKFILIACMIVLTFLPSAYALYYGPATLSHIVDPHDLENIEEKLGWLGSMLRSDLQKDTATENPGTGVRNHYEASKAPTGIQIPTPVQDPSLWFQGGVRKQTTVSLVLGSLFMMMGTYGGKRFKK